MSEFSGTWSTVEIAGKRADVYEPPAPATPGRAVMHLHGHGLTTLRDNAAYSAEFDRHGLYAICPHGQRSWWLDLICAEFDPQITPMRYLLDSVVPWIESRWGVRPPAIALSGNSMGGQGVLQLSYRYPREFPVVAAICPAIDFHKWVGQGLPLDEMFPDRESARQQTALLQIHPMNWPRHQLLVCDPTDYEWFEGVDRLGMKLSATGIPYEHDFKTSRGGHTWEYVDAMARPVMEFIASRLEQESRRIV